MQQLKRTLLRGIRKGGHLEGRGRSRVGRWLEGIAHDGGEHVQRNVEAVFRGAIL